MGKREGIEVGEVGRSWFFGPFWDRNGNSSPCCWVNAMAFIQIRVRTALVGKLGLVFSPGLVIQVGCDCFQNEGISESPLQLRAALV